MDLFDFDRALHAWIPSYHLCSSFALPAAPQLPNQEPPRPQQLILPDFLIIPHLEHKELTLVVVAAGVYAWELVKYTQEGVRTKRKIYIHILPNLRLQAPTPSSHL